jgi:hypothetical protein
MADQRPFANLASEATSVDVTKLLDEIAIRLADIADSVGNLSPDAAGRLRVIGEIVTTVTTVATVTNQAQMGGFATNQHIMALTQIAEDSLRRNIGVS